MHFPHRRLPDRRFFGPAFVRSAGTLSAALRAAFAIFLSGWHESQVAASMSVTSQATSAARASSLRAAVSLCQLRSSRWGQPQDIWFLDGSQVCGRLSLWRSRSTRTGPGRWPRC